MPYALSLLQMINLIFIGKLYSLDLLIKFLRFDPVPEIKTHAFFFTILKNLLINLFFVFEIYPIS